MSDSAWDAFAGTTAMPVNPRPDRFYCRACGGVWASRAPTKGKRGAVGFNRCPDCGAIYSEDALIKLAKPTDKFIKLIADGVQVTIDRRHVQAVWQQYRGDKRNAVLAQEQGVDIASLIATVPAATKAIAPSVAPGAVMVPEMPSTADWDAWAATK